MKIGIIGSGSIGGSLGRLWAQAGHEVFFSSRNPKTLSSLVESAPGAQAGTPKGAMTFGEVILEAVPFKAAFDLPVDDLAGKVLISASNYYSGRDGQIDLEGTSQSERLAKALAGTRFVKAFNMMQAGEMAALAEGGGRPGLAIFYAGDDDEAKKITATLIEEAKFAPVDAGSLAAGRHFESGAQLYDKKWTKKQACVALANV